MNGYVRDVLLALSLVGAPIIFGTLLYYGLTIKERAHHHDEMSEKPRAPDAPSQSDHDESAKAT